MRTYSELISIPDFKGRFEYLQQNSIVGEESFGCDRYLNQTFYNSPEWKRVRREAISRDNGCDMAHEDYPIPGKIIVHHINAITKDMILNRDPMLFDLNNLVCVSHLTHEAITYGDFRLIDNEIAERKPGDTYLW